MKSQALKYINLIQDGLLTEQELQATVKPELWAEIAKLLDDDRLLDHFHTDAFGDLSEAVEELQDAIDAITEQSWANTRRMLTAFELVTSARNALKGSK